MMLVVVSRYGPSPTGWVQESNSRTQEVSRKSDLEKRRSIMATFTIKVLLICSSPATFQQLVQVMENVAGHV